MPCSGESVPNLLSATAIDHRMAAQYGQNSAPMYSISGLPPAVRLVPLIVVIGLGLYDSTDPVPTLCSALSGTVRTSFWTLAGSSVPFTPPEAVLPDEPPAVGLITTK